MQKTYALPELGLQLLVHEPMAAYWRIVAGFSTMFSLAIGLFLLAGLTLYLRLAYGVKLVEAAVRDPLAGLNTRLYMNVWCEAAIRSHDRTRQAGIALIMFDLDRFKGINDRHGHLAGDEVLRAVGAVVRGAIRGDDLAVRFGGEKLAVFVRCAGMVEAVALAERILVGVEQHDFQGKGGRIAVTISAGVAFHEVGEALDALFARADAELYEAKEAGRNRICGKSEVPSGTEPASA